MTTPTLKPRWFHLTPDRLILGLLAVEGLLWLSGRLGWPTWHKGYAVLATVAAVLMTPLFMGLWFALALVFRWRFQFSLWSLLVLVVVVALPCSWLAVEMKMAREQREAVVAIENLHGGRVQDWQVGRAVSRLNGHPEPAWLRSWLGDDSSTRSVPTGTPTK